MDLLHPGVDDGHVAGRTSARTSLVVGAVAAHPAVVAGGVVCGGGTGGGEARGGRVAHVEGGGGEGRGLGGRGGDWGAAPVAGQLARRVPTVAQGVRNYGGVGLD